MTVRMSAYLHTLNFHSGSALSLYQSSKFAFPAAKGIARRWQSVSIQFGLVGTKNLSSLFITQWWKILGERTTRPIGFTQMRVNSAPFWASRSTLELL